MVVMFVLLRGSMLWGVVESGFMAAFFESGRGFSLMMRTPASELCFIATEDTRSRNCSNPYQIGVHATIQKSSGLSQIGLVCEGKDVARGNKEILIKV